jgi:hypothetical protein
MGAITDNPILLRRTNFLPELPYSACLGLDTVGSGMGQEEKLSKCGSLLGHLVYEECTLGVPASRHLSVSQEGSPGQRPHPGVLETSLSMGLSSGIPTVYILSRVIPIPPPTLSLSESPVAHVCHLPPTGHIKPITPSPSPRCLQLHMDCLNLSPIPLKASSTKETGTTGEI